jgi:gamma-glutamyltranspeptidase / glutathione hydrolase
MSMRIYSKQINILLLFFLFSAIIYSQSADPVRGKNGMVVSASELASQVGIDILKKGGNAVDAAVAVGFTLAVTYPIAGNLGGGGFMVIHLKNGKNTTIDYREKAPMVAKENLYWDSSGNYDPNLSQYGVTSVGVPGSVAGLIYALEKYGSLSLKDVIQPAIELAENGFTLEYHLANSLEYEKEYFVKYASTKKIFTNNGSPFKEGEKLLQSDLANTLKQIRDNGVKGFYTGKIAQLIVNQIRSDGGYITLEDLQSYNPVERVPIQTNYRGYDVVSMGPPSAGGITLLQLLNILENHKFEIKEWGSSNYIHLLVEAMKYVFADRSKHIGDPDFYNVPLNWLLSKDYAKEIFDKIDNTAIPSENILPGIPQSKESEETTHYSVIDKYGNAVSTTTTLNSSYGSKIVVEGAGFFLNNEMDDFSCKPGVANQFGLIGSEANKIESGKRMLSSMAPTIVMKDNKPYMIIGSPGGSTIPTVILQVILNILDFDMNIQQAIDMPRFHHQWLPDKIDYEKFGFSLDVIDSLKKKKHIIGEERILGRVEGIISDYNNQIFYGASDPRGYGAAISY